MGAGKGKTKRTRFMGVTPVRGANNKSKELLLASLEDDAVWSEIIGRFVDYMTELRVRVIVEGPETADRKKYTGKANSLAKTIRVVSGQGHAETLSILAHEAAHLLTPSRKLVRPRYDRDEHNATSYVIDRMNDKQLQSEAIAEMVALKAVSEAVRREGEGTQGRELLVDADVATAKRLAFYLQYISGRSDAAEQGQKISEICGQVWEEFDRNVFGGTSSAPEFSLEMSVGDETILVEF